MFLVYCTSESISYTVWLVSVVSVIIAAALSSPFTRLNEFSVRPGSDPDRRMELAKAANCEESQGYSYQAGLRERDPTVTPTPASQYSRLQLASYLIETATLRGPGVPRRRCALKLPCSLMWGETGAFSSMQQGTEASTMTHRWSILPR
jgi:hypothetical protein